MQHAKGDRTRPALKRAPTFSSFRVKHGIVMDFSSYVEGKIKFKPVITFVLEYLLNKKPKKQPKNLKPRFLGFRIRRRQLCHMGRLNLLYFFHLNLFVQPQKSIFLKKTYARNHYN